MKTKIIFVFLAFLYSFNFYNSDCPVCASETAEIQNAAVIPAENTSEAALAPQALSTGETAVSAATSEASIESKKVSLYEFGAGKCMQCKKMKPIIEELQKELEGKVEVKMFDVGVDKEITEKHKIMLIPCQVFLDGEGKEIFRHEGFFEKEEILAKLKELGAKL